MPGGYYLELKGSEKLRDQFRGRSLKGKVVLPVEFGYAAQYAVYVHEDPFAHHPIGKWRYLADPLNRGRGQMGKIIAGVLRRKKALADAMWPAVEWLREASQDEVPVDTGFLRNSWFARLA